MTRAISASMSEFLVQLLSEVIVTNLGIIAIFFIEIKAVSQ